jgi:DNA-binding transcriptional MerR regulator
MKISELARVTGVTVPTIKYYVREGLLPSGRQISATQADYDDGHVDRLRLVRALVEVGGLSLTVVGELLTTIYESGTDESSTDGSSKAESSKAGSPDSRPSDSGTRASGTDTAGSGEPDDEEPDDEADTKIADAIAAAHQALVPQPSRSMTPIAGVVPPEPDRARAAMQALGWQVDPDSAGLHQLETALSGLDSVGLPPGELTLDTYAQAALSIAEADVRSLPTGSAADAVRRVVLGTVMYDPVLIALRRLAQQHAYRTMRAEQEAARDAEQETDEQETEG